MSQLIKEYFDSKLEAQTKELKALTRGQTEERARMVADGFEDLQKWLDLVDRLHRLEADMRQIKETL